MSYFIFGAIIFEARCDFERSMSCTETAGPSAPRRDEKFAVEKGIAGP